ncbi:MAG: TonB-dependent receptor, partial [Pseudomonadota bacterium]|nr:TonB-dependent receptor [Pseudomonadota bacterium]
MSRIESAIGLLSAALLLPAYTSALAQGITAEPPNGAIYAAAEESNPPVEEAMPNERDVDSGNKKKRGGRFIEEIVVTAQKREESLQDVPISVQAFSADALDARGIEEPKALQLVTPGMQYNIIAGYTIIFIRGVGTDAFIPSADASVATYVDNIYYPFGHGLAAALGEIERVEVLKGPQGTLFGRNSTAGAINIITRQPGPEFESSVTTSFENYDKKTLRVFTNIPLTDTISFSVSGLRYEEESYYELRESPRPSLPEEISKAFSTKIGWAPTDELHAVIGYSEVKTQGSQAMLFPSYDVKPLGRVLGVQEQPDYTTSIDAPTYIDSENRVFSADIKYTLPLFDTRLIVGDQAITSYGLVDFDGSNQPLVSFDAKGQFADVTTGEFQLISNATSWGSDWLNWIAGLYYIDSEAGFDPLVFNVAPNVYQTLLNPAPGSPLGSLLGPLGVGQLTGFLDNQLSNLAELTSIPLQDITEAYLSNGVQLSLNGVLGTKSYATFFQTTAAINDWFSITLGGRYQEETRQQLKSNTDVALFANSPDQTITVLNFRKGKAKSSNFSPKLVFDFKFDDDMVYLTYSKGYKSGTYNIISIYTPSEYIKPEEVTSYEIGYKSILLDGAMRFNAAIFQNTIDNLQVQTVAILSGGVARFENAGSGRVRGADFDLTWQLFPEALPGLAFNAGGAYLDGV